MMAEAEPPPTPIREFSANAEYQYEGWQGKLLAFLCCLSLIASLMIILPYKCQGRLRRQYPDFLLCYIAGISFFLCISLLPSIILDLNPIGYQDSALCTLQGVFFNALRLEVSFLLMLYMFCYLPVNLNRRRPVHIYFFVSTLFFFVIFSTLPFIVKHADFKLEMRAFGPKGVICTIEDVNLLFSTVHIPIALMSLITIYCALHLTRYVKNVGHFYRNNHPGRGIFGQYGICGCTANGQNNNGDIDNSQGSNIHRYLSFSLYISIFAIVHSTAMIGIFAKSAIDVGRARSGNYYTYPEDRPDVDTFVLMSLVLIQLLIIFTAPHVRTFYSNKGLVNADSKLKEMPKLKQKQYKSSDTSCSSCSNSSHAHKIEGIISRESECIQCQKENFQNPQPAEEFVDISLD